MSRESSYTYDPSVGNWTENTTTSGGSSSSGGSSGGSSSSSSNSYGNSYGNSNSTHTPYYGGGNLTYSSSDKTSSTGQVEKEYNEIQINTLTGTLNFIVTEETIKLTAGDTVKLEGLGKYLSGDYFVEEVTRSVGSNGYTHSATVIKTDFGDTLKTKSDGSNDEEDKNVSSSPNSNNSNRKHTVKPGDCLWNLAKYYYGRGVLWYKIYDANRDKIFNPHIIFVGQVLVIP